MGCAQIHVIERPGYGCTFTFKDRFYLEKFRKLIFPPKMVESAVNGLYKKYLALAVLDDCSTKVPRSARKPLKFLLTQEKFSLQALTRLRIVSYCSCVKMTNICPLLVDRN
jgi:hypothetical protein